MSMLTSSASINFGLYCRLLASPNFALIDLHGSLYCESSGHVEETRSVAAAQNSRSRCQTDSDMHYKGAKRNRMPSF